MKERIKPTRPHKHDAYHEIIYLNDGAGFHTIDDRVYEVNPPVLFFLTPGQVHCWEFAKIPKGFVCIFRDEFLEDVFESRRHLQHFPAMFASNTLTGGIIHDFEQLIAEFQSEAYDRDILRSYLNVILLKLLKSATKMATQVKSIHPVVIQYKNLVDKNYLTQRELSFYIDALRTTKRRLTDLCKQELGRTATSLISERLVMESKRLLTHTAKTMSEISFELSFNDPSYFVKFFKKHTNLTPGEYRKQIN
jgi:AraC-like DNA-binding protein